MKTLNKILAVTLAAASVTSCADLDAVNQSYYVTPEDKQEVAAMDPAKAQAAVTGCFSNFNVCQGVFSEHFDFGYPAIMLGLDLQALDVQCKYTGYNWHISWERYDSPNYDSEQSYMMWRTMYNQIFTTNALIASADLETTNKELQFYNAQGYALRAYDYFVLAQSYAFNYAGHEDDLCVPIITNENSEQAAADGAPRATVKEVYEQILKDINTAIELLDASGLQPSQVISSKPKRMMSAAAAYGLRARINLVMHNYKEAAADAQTAIEKFTGKPYSMDELSRPTFSSLDDAAWMWGIAIAETDRVVTTGIVNWPSFMVTFCDGYVGNGAWKYCGYQIYDYLSSSDVRKGWFLDDNYKSSHINAEEQAYIDQFIPADGPIYGTADSSSSLFPQTNVKFASYQNVLLQSVNSNDIPLMRIEEMYLIQAEATGMDSNNLGQGKQLLETFVKTYRNPNYTCTASSVEEFVNECWMQRRAEFWGEGLSFFDIKRLGKPVDRANNRTCYRYRFNIPADSPVLNYCVPREEVNANPLIPLDKAGVISDSPLPFHEDIDY